jgi:hypothetical protein
VKVVGLKIGLAGRSFCRNFRRRGGRGLSLLQYEISQTDEDEGEKKGGGDFL